MPETPAILRLVAAWRLDNPVKSWVADTVMNLPMQTQTKTSSGEG
jgi:hypothetical protein